MAVQVVPQAARPLVHLLRPRSPGLRCSSQHDSARGHARTALHDHGLRRRVDGGQHCARPLRRVDGLPHVAAAADAVVVFAVEIEEADR